jgi:DNA-binding beta-propeller fold protein YncE
VVFADEGDGSLRRFEPAAGRVTTLARLAPPQPGLPSLPWGVAYDGADKIYVTDRSADAVYALDLRTNALALVAGRPGVRGGDDGTVAQALFDSPAGIAFDAGALYVADVGNRGVRRIDLVRGTVVTLARGFTQPWGLCADGGALYLADSLQEAVFRIDPTTGASTVLAGFNRFGYLGQTNGRGRAARFRTIRGMDCGGGALFLADQGNAQVRRLDLATSVVTSVAGSTTGGLGHRDGQGAYALFRDMQSVLRVGDTLYIGDEAAMRAVSLPDAVVTTVAGTGDGTYLDVSLLEQGGLLEPEGIAVSAADGTAFVAGGGSRAIHRVDLATGATMIFAGAPGERGFADATGTDARFGAPTAIATDGHGTLFVGDADNHAVRAVRIGTREVETIVGTPSVCGNDDGTLRQATLCDPSGLAFTDGALFVADAATQTVRRVDLSAGTVSTLAGTPYARGHADGRGAVARFATPAALAFEGGSLFVADGDDGLVRRVNVATGEVTTVAGARFDRPRALAASGSDALLVADAAAVSRLSLSTGQVTRLCAAGRGLRAGSAEPSLGHPAGLAALAPGEAVVVDRSEDVVVRLAY